MTTKTATALRARGHRVGWAAPVLGKMGTPTRVVSDAMADGWPTAPFATPMRRQPAGW
jgi:hypothetical protein